MREHIVTEEFKGKLKIGDKYEFDKVRCIFHYDVYSNKTMNGEFIIEEDISDNIWFRPSEEDFKLTYSDNDGRTIIANYRGSNLETKYNSRRTVINFDVKEYGQSLRYSDKASKKLTVYFNIPYLSPLARDLQNSWGFEDDEYLVKFVDKPVKINCENYEITFDERVGLVKHEEPDYIFNRWISLKVETDLVENDILFDVLTKHEDFMDDFTLVLSLLIHHSANWFAYHAQTVDSENRLVIDNHFKTRKKISGKDFLKEIKDEFKEFFNKENIELLIKKFRGLDADKETFIRVIHGYNSIKSMDVLEPQFITAYSELEGISKLIVKPNRNTKSEELIKSAAEIHSINLDEFNFKISPKKIAKPSNEFEWLITDYRNYLIHSNNDEFDVNELIPEYCKMMHLLRKLIIAYLEPSLKDFPYPSGEYYYAK